MVKVEKNGGGEPVGYVEDWTSPNDPCFRCEHRPWWGEGVSVDWRSRMPHGCEVRGEPKPTKIKRSSKSEKRYTCSEWERHTTVTWRDELTPTQLEREKKASIARYQRMFHEEGKHKYLCTSCGHAFDEIPANGVSCPRCRNRVIRKQRPKISQIVKPR